MSTAGGARLRGLLDEVFGLDLRALALFRISMGLLIALDMLDRMGDITAHYADDGALPRALVPASAGHVSLHMLSGDARWEAALMALELVCALCLALGLGTRIAVFLTWVLEFSLQGRNPLVLYGGDIALRLMLFWSLFLPLGELWSLDRWRRPPRGARVLSMGTASYAIQIGLIYVFTAALKSGPAWHDGTAIWYALNIDHFTSPWGRRLLAWPELLRALTVLVLAFESVGPWLLLVPRWWVRTPVVLGFIAMHASFQVLMEIGFFPWICMIYWIPLLPGPLLDRARLPRLEGPTLGAGRLQQGLAGVALIYILWWNLGGLYPKTFAVTGDWRAPARALRLDQYWDMFAPQPFKDDGWFVIVGHRADGHDDDVLHGGPPVWAKPWDVAHIYKNERWRKYMRNLWDRNYAELRDPYLRWICATWNSHASARAKLQEISMYYMLEPSRLPGERVTPKKVLLRELRCPSALRGISGLPRADVAPAAR